MEWKGVTAAWHADMSAEAQSGLVVAQGEPHTSFLVDDLNRVIEAIEFAQQASARGLTVVGGVSYEAAPAFDSALHTQVASSFPLAFFNAYLPSQLSVYSAQQIETCLVAKEKFQSFSFQPWVDQSDTAWFDTQFQQIQNAIEQGEFYQLNFTTRLHSQLQPAVAHDAFSFFLLLYQAQPAAQSVFVRLPQWDVLSLSPELFFKWDGKTLSTSPMKGTRKTQLNAVDSLRDSEKDLAENVMIVDLLRNDLARVCLPRTVHVRSLFDVMTLPTVEQMTSTIVGQTQSHVQLLDVFKALFPCGSVTGAPKPQAMKRIAEWEHAPRDLYCGALGVVNHLGHAHFNVPIRTLLLNKASKQVVYGVGSGITWYSQPQDERREWWQKTAFLRQATQDFEVLETVRLSNGQWVRLDGHLKRMKAAAHYFAFVFNESSIQTHLAILASQHAIGQLRGRWRLSAEGEFTVELFEAPAPCHGVHVLLASEPMQERGHFIQFKTTWRPHYDRFMVQENVFDSLLFDRQGFLTESCRANLVLKINEVLYTPKQFHEEGCNLLSGVYREALLGENVLVERKLTINDLYQAQALWLINSLREWVSVAQVLDVKGNVLINY